MKIINKGVSQSNTEKKKKCVIRMLVKKRLTYFKEVYKDTFAYIHLYCRAGSKTGHIGE